MHDIDKVTEAFSLARLRAVHLRPYFATALYRVVPVLTDQIPTLAVDKWWRLYYSAEFVQNTPILEVATGILHEIEHLLRNHHHRCQMNGFEPDRWNYAADAEINDELESRRDLKLISGAVLPKHFRMNNGLTAEEYYEKVPKITYVNCGSGAHGRPQPGELGAPNGIQRGISPEEGELVRKKVAEDTVAWANKHPGNVPGSLLQWADQILKPKVPWQRVLRGVFRSHVARVSGMADYSFSRPHRRQSLFPDFILPALVEPVANVAIIIDTSGSMSGLLSQAMAEVRGVLRSSGAEQAATVFSVDCALQSAKKVFNPKSVQLLGGGGTDMGVGLAAAEKLRPKPDFAVVLTDGFTPWPEHPPKGMQTIVVLLDRGVSPGWARTINAS